MKSLDRLMAYSAAVLCSVLLWVSIASPAGTWQKPAGLFVGLAGPVTMGMIILRSRW